MNNIAMITACVLAVVFGMTLHPILSIMTCFLGVTMCLVCIDKRDHPEKYKK